MQLVDRMASEQRRGWWSWKGPAETGDKEESGDLLALAWEAQRAARLGGTGLTARPAAWGEAPQQRAPVVPQGTREILALQFAWDLPIVPQA